MSNRLTKRPTFNKSLCQKPIEGPVRDGFIDDMKMRERLGLPQQTMEELVENLMIDLKRDDEAIDRRCDQLCRDYGIPNPFKKDDD